MASAGTSRWPARPDVIVCNAHWSTCTHGRALVLLYIFTSQVRAIQKKDDLIATVPGDAYAAHALHGGIWAHPYYVVGRRTGRNTAAVGRRHRQRLLLDMSTVM